MKITKPYAELVTQAEEATRSIKDPELRRVAFERVLDDLLAGSPEAHSSGESLSKPKPSTARTQNKDIASRGPKGYIRELVDDGFFKKPKTIAEVKAELGNRGHHIARTSLSGPLQSLCQDHILRRHKTSSNGKGKKAVYNYSEW